MVVKPTSAPPPAAGRGAEAVVVGALVRIGQDGVRLADLFEAVFGLLVAGVLVGVVGPREVAVGLFQITVAGVARDAEDRVVVAGGHLRELGEGRKSRAPGRSGRGSVRLAGGAGVGHRHGDHGRPQDAPVQHVAPRGLRDHGHLRLSRAR